jgi:hypothetical protein
VTTDQSSLQSETFEMQLNDLVYVGFNSRVAALDRGDGRVVWDWKSPTGSGYVSLLLLDEASLIVSVVGYTYCLDPLTGSQIWFNRMTSFGSGVTSIAAWGAAGTDAALQQAAAASAAAAAASAAAAAAGYAS